MRAYEVRGTLTPARLAEVLDAATGRVVCDVRSVPGEPDFDAPYSAAARRLVELLAERSGDDVAVTSLDWFAVEVARDAGLRTGFRTPRGVALDAALAYVVDARHAECHPHWSAVLDDPGAVARAHDAGVAVVAWAVDDPTVAGALREAGVDGVVTELHDD